MMHPYPGIGFVASTIVCSGPAPHQSLNTDAGGEVADLLLPRLTLCLFSMRTLPAAYADPLDRDRSTLVCACAPIANLSVIATMSAVRISASLRVTTVK